jgi:hypothetical protein
MSEILTSNSDQRKKTLPRCRDSVRTPLFLAGSFELRACTASQPRTRTSPNLPAKTRLPDYQT